MGGHINIRSILPKIDQINRLLTDSNLDYLCVTESWLNPSTPTDLINIPGFKCYRRDRDQGRGGSVLLYIKDIFKCEKVNIDVKLECLGLNVILSPTMKFKLITKTYNLITGLTDHNMTLVVRKLSKKCFINHNKAENKMKTTGIPKAKRNSFENELNQINWNSITAETDLNLSASKFVTKLNDVINKYTKTWTRKPRKYSLPWFNKDIWLIAKNRDLALKKFLKSRNNTDHLIFTGLRNKVTSELRKAKTKYFIKMIEDANGSSSKLWQHINKLTNSNRKNHQMTDCLKTDDNYVNDNQSIANEFNKFFVESVYDLAKPFKGKLPFENKVQLSSTDLLKIREVSHDKVRKIIVNMKNSISRDIHYLNAALIKKTSKQFTRSHYLPCKLVNTNKHFPTELEDCCNHSNL